MSGAENGIDPALRILVTAVLREDIGTGDVTTIAAISETARGTGRIRAKERGVLSGLAVARAVFLTVDGRLHFSAARNDGQRFEAGETIASISGSARAIVIAERVALNFLARLAGIATLTAAFVERVAGTGAQILDTRKTTPGLRFLEKQAVLHGGGRNHRRGLFDAFMIKDNHIAAAGGLSLALRRVQDYRRELPPAEPALPLIVEARNVDEARLAAKSGADRILLDNFAPRDVGGAVDAIRAVRGRAIEIEISGGVTLENVREFALPGVDFISIGALTHSAPAIDFSLDFAATGEEL